MKEPSLLIMIITVFLSPAWATSLELQEDLIKIQKQYDLPSLSAAVIQNGELKEIASAGVRKLGFPNKVTVDDKAHIGSCAKSMTATLAASIIEENKLSWRTTIQELFPKLKVHSKLKNLSFDMLLAHRTGLRSNMEELYDVLSNEELTLTNRRKSAVKTILEKGPQHTPGEYNYSNLGYVTVGHILERITGKSFETLITEKLFLPLGMKSCGFGPTSSKLATSPKQPWGHQENDNKLNPVHADNPIAISPAGTIHCSLKDWGKYLSIHVDGFNGIKKLISLASFKKLHTLYPADKSDYTFGGWVRVKRSWAKGAAFHHAGTNTFNYANVWIAPKLKTIFMSTTNVMKNGHAATDKAMGFMMKRHLK